jgi:hypothetical protein
MDAATKQRYAAGLLVVAGLLIVIGTITPWATLSGVVFSPYGISGTASWNGFGGDGDAYMLPQGGIIWTGPFWQNAWLKSVGIFTTLFGLGILVVGLLRVKNRSLQFDRIGKIIALVLATASGLAAVTLLLAIASWISRTKETNVSPYDGSPLTSSIGIGVWILIVGAIVATAGGITWGSSRLPDEK